MTTRGWDRLVRRGDLHETAPADGEAPWGAGALRSLSPTIRGHTTTRPSIEEEDFRRFQHSPLVVLNNPA